MGWVFAYRASCARVGLDAASILTVNNLRIQELNTIDDIVALAANRSDAKTMTTGAVHVGDDDVCTRSDSNTVILVINMNVIQSNVVTGRDVETVAVVRSGQATALGIGLVAKSVIKNEP